MIRFEEGFNPERPDKKEIISIIKDNPNNPESKSAFLNWVSQAKIEADASGSGYPKLIFDIELTDVYIEAGMINAAIENLEEMNHLFEIEKAKYDENNIPDELLSLHAKFISLGLKVYG
ncbi:hypothetical protein H7X65_00790 [Candidatus Parcubacteria bacterium]|nr:hypothetical protein [Candidatus Parcubacteria bacterium]